MFNKCLEKELQLISIALIFILTICFIVDSHTRILASDISHPEDSNIPSNDLISPTEILSADFIAPSIETIASTIITPNIDNEATKEGN